MIEEKKLLYNLARNCSGKGVIVEIGSWKGETTICLAQGSKDGKGITVYTIDPHTGSSEHREIYGEVWTFDEFKKNLKDARIDDLVVPIVKTSAEAEKGWNNPVELIFVDGAHEYELVELDFQLWFPHVIDGGIMAFHDTIGFAGPKKVVEKYIHRSRYFKNVGFVGSTTYATKTRKNSIVDRLRARYILVLRNMYEFAGGLKLSGSVKGIGKKILEIIQ